MKENSQNEIKEKKIKRWHKKHSLRFRVINEGFARGRVVKSSASISFFGGVNPETGIVVEKGHPLYGRNISKSILVFPAGKGSTVGSYVLYRMAKKGVAPSALVMENCDSVIAIGSVISKIPCVDKVNTGLIDDGDVVEISAKKLIIKKAKKFENPEKENKNE